MAFCMQGGKFCLAKGKIGVCRKPEPLFFKLITTYTSETQETMYLPTKACSVQFQSIALGKPRALRGKSVIFTLMKNYCWNLRACVCLLPFVSLLHSVPSREAKTPYHRLPSLPSGSWCWCMSSWHNYMQCLSCPLLLLIKAKVYWLGKSYPWFSDSKFSRDFNRHRHYAF